MLALIPFAFLTSNSVSDWTDSKWIGVFGLESSCAVVSSVSLKKWNSGSRGTFLPLLVQTEISFSDFLKMRKQKQTRWRKTKSYCETA